MNFDDSNEEDDFIVDKEGVDDGDDDEPGALVHICNVDEDDVQIKKRKKKKNAGIRKTLQNSPRLIWSC